MSELTLTELTPPDAVSEFERASLKANQRMAELGITRVDYRDYGDGLRRYLDHLSRRREKNHD